MSANSTCSPQTLVRSGVPQGSVLGPLLFPIYINDPPCEISFHIHLFADDSVLFHEITSNDEVAAFQADCNTISVWCQLQMSMYGCIGQFN